MSILQCVKYHCRGTLRDWEWAIFETTATRNFVPMPKRILFLSDIDSSHTRKWAVSLAQRGYMIGIFSLRKSDSNWFAAHPEITVYDREGFGKAKFNSGTSSKLSYLKLLPALKEAISLFKPEIVHAHYATSYGLMGVRSGFHPLIISVWGSDVFEFPRKSWLHRMIVKRNLRKADAVFSTSEAMKLEVAKLGRNDVHVTPFGVDTTFYSKRKVDAMFSENTRVIGAIKTLESHYGIDVLIRAFEIVKHSYKEELKLVICGAGTQELELKKMAADSQWKGDIIFTGAIPQEKVPEYLNRFDVFANLSLHESFGVAVVEAMACGIPVVLSDAVGLKEVTDNGAAGMVVPAGNEKAAAAALLNLLNNPEFRAEMAVKGRRRVEENYDWNSNLSNIESLYSRYDSVKQERR